MEFSQNTPPPTNILNCEEKNALLEQRIKDLESNLEFWQVVGWVMTVIAMASLAKKTVNAGWFLQLVPRPSFPPTHLACEEQVKTLEERVLLLQEQVLFLQEEVRVLEASAFEWSIYDNFLSVLGGISAANKGIKYFKRFHAWRARPGGRQWRSHLTNKGLMEKRQEKAFPPHDKGLDEQRPSPWKPGPRKRFHPRTRASRESDHPHESRGSHLTDKGLEERQPSPWKPGSTGDCLWHGVADT
ncbi:hypothetical protein PG991_001578 [Apiospora marii]|uniref:Uncharacterized protein n=1 Tax=Apiospora marii TaxID=335849 RepID=A0ABR1SRH3_9PEZI